ncbi:MAG: hypothetical protein KKD48_01985 [Nanoarchaeota archaeon]|nr:hypothetical protein [Nanoarchaeota archaeon]
MDSEVKNKLDEYSDDELKTMMPPDVYTAYQNIQIAKINGTALAVTLSILSAIMISGVILDKSKKGTIDDSEVYPLAITFGAGGGYFLVRPLFHSIQLNREKYENEVELVTTWVTNNFS